MGGDLEKSIVLNIPSFWSAIGNAPTIGGNQWVLLGVKNPNGTWARRETSVDS
jgi:hypothetical protein